MDQNLSFTYCGQDQNITPAWISNGFSRCLYFTVSDVLLLIVSFILIAKILKIKKEAVIVEAKYIPKSLFFYLQVVCMILLVLEIPVEFGLQFGLTTHHTSGLAIFDIFSRLTSVLCCFWLLFLERTMKILSSSYKGHSKSILSCWSVLLVIEVLSVVSWNSTNWWFKRLTTSNQIDFYLWIVRLTTSFFLLVIGLWSPGVPNLQNYLIVNNNDLDRDVENGNNNNVNVTTNNERNRSTWNGLKYKLGLLLPNVWPSKSIPLQIRVFACLLILVAGRIVNPYVPIYSKKIVNSLSEGSAWGVVAGQVVVYTALRYLQGSGGGSGLLNSMRSFLWLRVQQYTNRNIQLKLFSHLHSLSLRWHLSRKTGEVLRSIDRGTASINNILSYIVFSIMPTMADIIIAVVYFITAFNAWFGLIIFVCLALYLTCTIVITEWRTKFRRDMNLKDNKAKQRAIDSLLNFETVKYYNAESYEVKKFETAILDYQDSEYTTGFSLVFLNMSQATIINLGLLGGSLLCAKFVLDDKFDVGDYVLFGTYIIQLYTPLGYFGTYYRMIQSSFIDMENMFDLFKEDTEVVDDENADELPLGMGRVEFKDVYFHYKPQRQILKGVSFSVEPGQSLALVGQSGSGKSTIIRLLLRFYDISSGSIEIDGVDISTVTQKSLRNGLGVVPQDTVLFNDDIMSNIRYGKVDASDEEVMESAKLADIHHRILNMPDGYQTKVGERGLKLSGGEKQRVAIARTLLKSPNIVLLDEATSALDTATERNIQASLATVCAGRTSIVVAHRLSTIVHCDQILVLNEGEIIERGSHNELLEIGGIYSNLWNEQLNETSDAVKQTEEEKKSK